MSNTDKTTIRPGREGLIALARRPFVQGLLAFTVLGQVAAVHAGSLAAEPNVTGATAKASEPIRLAPVAATFDNAKKEDPTPRRAEELGEEYRAKGYSVSPELARQIGKAAAEFSIDPEVAFGLVKAESSFRNSATSTVGAVGLTQLMPRTASWMEPGVTRGELRDPETNLRVGFKYLRYLMDKYNGDENLALLAYNRGPGTVDKALKRGGNPDNGYADFVKGKANHGHKLFTR